MPLHFRSSLRAGAALAAAAAVVATAGCAGEDAPVDAAERDLNVTNCGAEVHFDHVPNRVVMLKPSAVTYLHDLGMLDHVIARAGAYPDEYYDEATIAELDDVPMLSDELDPSGHLMISKETVMDQDPDLVLGENDALPRSSLAAVDIPLIEEPAFCATDSGEPPSFDDVYAQMDLYGEIFDVPGEAEKANAALKEQLERIEPVGDGRTAAVLYPTVGGGVTYAYGTGSMSHPQLEAAGFTNAYADTEERVFEVTLEELLGRDPDVLILLYSEGDPDEVVAALENLPGADQLIAVKNDDVMTQLLNFSEPATPLSVDGVENIVERFGEGS